MLGRAKTRMLNEHLLDRGINDPRVLRAIARVPREQFVLREYLDDAYADCALPIDCGQTISQPYIVGLMTEALGLTGYERVLEVGTGSGFQTAVLAELASEVVTIERHARLSQQAEGRLTHLGYHNVKFVVGDGSLGWPAGAPYQRIIVTAATDHVPPALFEQLADDGRLVIPIGPADSQSLLEFHKHNGQFQSRVLSECRFVPLVS